MSSEAAFGFKAYTALVFLSCGMCWNAMSMIVTGTILGAWALFAWEHVGQ